MTVPLRHRDSRVSDVPTSCEMFSGETAIMTTFPPPSWDHQLQQAVLEAPCSQGVPAAAQHLLRFASGWVPECSLSLSMSPPQRAMFTLRVPPIERPQGALPADFSREYVEVVRLPWPAELRLATHLDLVQSEVEVLLHDLASALVVVVRLAMASETEQENARLLRQLGQAEKLASIGRLAASTLHEFNNPLSTILAYSEYLHRKAERAPLAVEDVERLRRIQEAAERIRWLTRNLTDYARPSGEVFHEFSLTEVIEQALAFCEHPIAEAGAQVVRRFEASTDRVRGVRGELTQVFVNLILNACHAMPRGQGQLCIQTRSEGAFCEVRLRDNGHGVEAQHAPHIFEPFYTTKSASDGTGLGLSIVRSLLERHHGFIEFCTPEGPGAEFVVRLPQA